MSVFKTQPWDGAVRHKETRTYLHYIALGMPFPSMEQQCRGLLPVDTEHFRACAVAGTRGDCELELIFACGKERSGTAATQELLTPTRPRHHVDHKAYLNEDTQVLLGRHGCSWLRACNNDRQQCVLRAVHGCYRGLRKISFILRNPSVGVSMAFLWRGALEF